MGYCVNMLENITIYTSDEYWLRILTDLGANVVKTPENADVIFDDITIYAPISVDDLQRLILTQFNNDDIIRNVVGTDVSLPKLQRKIIVALYKNPDIKISELKQAVGIIPDIATHSVENAIYQLRKIYGHDFIQNINGKYKLGSV